MITHKSGEGCGDKELGPDDTAESTSDIVS